MSCLTAVCLADTTLAAEQVLGLPVGDVVIGLALFALLGVLAPKLSPDLFGLLRSCLVGHALVSGHASRGRRPRDGLGPAGPGISARGRALSFHDERSSPGRGGSSADLGTIKALGVQFLLYFGARFSSLQSSVRGMISRLLQLVHQLPLSCLAVHLVQDLLGLGELAQHRLVISQRGFAHEKLLLLLELGQLPVDVRIDEVVDILAIQDFGNDIVLPAWVLQDGVLPEVDRVDAGASKLLHSLLLELLPLGVLRIWELSSSLLEDAIGDAGGPALRGGSSGDLESILEVGGLAGTNLLLDAALQQEVASLGSSGVNSILRRAGCLEKVNSLLSTLLHGVQELFLLGREVRHRSHVRLVQNDQQRAIPEKWLDGVEQGHLGGDGIAAHFGNVYEEENGRGQVR
mmetsp:Transcript_36018/g.76804  ORF Transcript_36018/g.76804 Transcript_36018/m.76804 type:complete len:403 (-) Transcript_36018:809-2017(-)